ncbi:metallo-beta-lactamase [Palaeococcus pacificus DY20341]|uniref:Metallo-beta-lactamase n=1 Tax=Palaeococcus pacificus DY20341 TaxID=1343739 RepID=A0A075LU25_9EURY|nr:MBL fold metallo-hydrolase [Palaeococcus pacificus]AIF69616.1 metallo-beta-lactamase [Palaeococcus pacificus DY20341]
MKITVIFENHSGFRKGLFGGHGFSVLVEHKGHKILVDTGVDGKVLLKNMKSLGVNPNDVDYLFLTHGHYDHTYGIKSLLEVREEKLPIIAHPDVFSKRVALKPRLRDISLPFRREELKDLGAEFILVSNPFEIVEGIWGSGEIERRTWDRTVGYKIREGKLIKDDVRDDMALILDLDDGIAAITGCGHSGILNIAMHARDVMGKPLKALIGGFHLINAKNRIINEAIKGLKDMEVQKLYAGHCTGFDAMAQFKMTFGESFEPLYVGKVIEL